MHNFQSQLKPFYKQEKIITADEVEKNQNLGKEFYVLDAGRTYSPKLKQTGVPLQRKDVGGSQRPTTKGINPYDSNNMLGMAQIMAQTDEIELKSPNTREKLILKRKFEDNESNIIHDLYAKHFHHKQKANEEAAEENDARQNKLLEGDHST